MNSAISVRRASSLDQDVWNNYVAKHPDGNIYQHFAFKPIFEQAYNSRGVYLLAETDDTICGICPLVFVKPLLKAKRLIATAYCDGGGLLVDNQETMTALKQAALDSAYQLKAQAIEWRNLSPCGNARASTEQYYLRKSVSGAADEILASCDPEQQQKLTSLITPDLRLDTISLQQFYPLYKRWQAQAKQPRLRNEFFEQVLLQLPAELLGLYQQDKLIAAALVFTYKQQLVPYVYGMGRGNSELIELLQFKLLAHSAAKGLEAMHLGLVAAEFIDSNSWGADPQPIYYQGLEL